MATRIPIPGETFGPYRILRLLGHGGMGRVFEAEHVETGRRVALKVMGQTLASDQDRKRFLREGRLAASVNHPNVVYIHGSEEIDGVPIIAMELVHGGTLKDRLKQGLPPIAEAVESTLQLIEGLEAANSAGVLHRDIKPANCFVAADGSVKVGDFGLSVSTLARGESLLTATGSVMGTPAYASPEQLRGEELDVRSDIYSVGATLYHLLTGNTPFGATDFVKLITEVLDKEPANPRAHRSEIPAELARVVLRCLAKDRKARFQTYADLHDALLPFRTAEVVPAKPAMRFCAALIDDLIAYGPSWMFLAYWSFDPLDHLARTRTPAAFMQWLPFFVAYLLYYSIAEGRWGAGVGKLICGLRVVNANREAPGIARSALRVLIYAIPFTLPPFLLMTFTSLDYMRAVTQRGEWLVTDWAWVPFTILLFITMRARNGYAALQDLISRTRVIVRPKTQQRPKLASTSSASTTTGPSFDVTRNLGPYEATRSLWKTADAELIEAFDPVLRRKVWIHLTANTERLNDARRDLSRATRLRWIDGGTANGNAWNAYDALGGEAFLAVAQTPRSWDAVRFWLLDLAEEIEACAQNGASATAMSLDRLWITASGRAVLLDFPAPGVTTTRAAAPVDCRDNQAVQAFLASVAAIALEGKVAATPKMNSIVALVPLHARAFLTSITAGTFDEVRYIVGNLRSLISKPAEITRTRRTAALLLVPAFALGMSVLLGALVTFERARWDRVWAAHYPGEPSLRVAAEIYVDALDEVTDFNANLEDLRLTGTYIAQHFASTLSNETFWAAQPTLIFVPDMRTRVREAVEANAKADRKTIDEAERSLSKRIARFEKAQRLAFVRVGTVTMIVIVILAAMIDGISILGFRVPSVLRLFGIAVVNRAGERASRGRLLTRWLVTWAPTVAAMLLINAFARALTKDAPHFSSMVDFALLLNLVIVVVAALVFAARNPKAGIADYATGTRLVPL